MNKLKTQLKQLTRLGTQLRDERISGAKFRTAEKSRLRAQRLAQGYLKDALPRIETALVDAAQKGKNSLTIVGTRSPGERRHVVEVPSTTSLYQATLREVLVGAENELKKLGVSYHREHKNKIVGYCQHTGATVCEDVTFLVATWK